MTGSGSSAAPVVYCARGLLSRRGHGRWSRVGAPPFGRPVSSPHSCARHRNPAKARLRLEGTFPQSQNDLPRPKTWAHRIPVTSTGKRKESGSLSLHVCGLWRPRVGEPPFSRAVSSPHSCARHRNPAKARLRLDRTLPQSQSHLSRPRTWAHWIPVTSTGMREESGSPSLHVSGRGGCSTPGAR